MSLLFDIVKQVKGKSIEKTDIDTYKLRIATCKGCPELFPTGNCKICGCFVKDKAQYKEEKCPKNKW